MIRLIFAAILLGSQAVAWPASERSAEEEVMRRTWFEMRSGSFRVFSCASTQTVLQVVRRLEQFRSAYGEMAGWQAVTTPPILVMVYPDTKSMWTFGHVESGTGEIATNYAGVFHADDEENLIVMVPPRGEAAAMETVFHEYTHLLLRHNGPYWPDWLTEGMAEVYSTMEVDDHQVRIGKPRSDRLRMLARAPLMPLPQLLSVGRESLGQKSPGKVHLFYAQSWLLTHYLMLGGNAYYRDRFPTLTTLLRQGQSPGQAFTNTFGPRLSLLEDQLRQYLAQGQFNIWTNRIKADLSAVRPPSLRMLALPEVCFRLGYQLFRVGRPKEAEVWFGKSRTLAPQAAWSSVGLGLLAARQGKSAEAVRFLEEAIQRGGGDHLVYFNCAKARYTLAAPGVNGPSHSRLPKNVAEEIRGQFRKSIALMPPFGPAHYWLGYLETAQGEDLAAAEQQLQLAVQLEPRDQWYLLPLADVQIRRRRSAEARATLRPLLRAEAPASLRQQAEEMSRRLPR